MPNTRMAVLLRSVEDLVDAKELRAAISAALVQTPINDHTIRCAVWTFVGIERQAGVPPAQVIARLANLIEDAKIGPTSLRLDLTRRVILWCVEEYFGCLGSDVATIGGSRDEPAVTASRQ